MRGNHATHRRQYGITLIELMIVVAIIAILAAIGYPSYRDYVRRSNRAEGKSELMNAAALQEKFFSNNNTYTTDMTALGLDNTDPAITEKGFYSVDAAACAGGTIATCYVLTATPVAGGGQSDDTKCTSMTIDSRGSKGGAGAQCNCATADTCW
jgi:type IV pilus assembly protein PilE